MAETTSVSEAAAALLADLKEQLGLYGVTGERALRRAAYVTGVVIVHILFVYLLVISRWVPEAFDLAARQAPMTWVSLMQKTETPKPAPPTPKEESPNTVPTMIPPTFTPPKVEENNAIDWGLAIGRSLACGANSYEYLSPRGRMACLHRPWNFVYDRYGNIVLQASARPAQEEKPRNSDIQARERYTTPRCPKNIDPNAPCLSDIIGSQP